MVNISKVKFKNRIREFRKRGSKADDLAKMTGIFQSEFRVLLGMIYFWLKLFLPQLWLIKTENRILDKFLTSNFTKRDN